MGSELDEGLLLEGVRGIRGVKGGDGVLRGGGDDGPIVAPSRPASSPITVAPVSGSAGSPHEEQNLPAAEIFAPHFEQNIGGGDSTIGPSLAVNACKSQLRNSLHLDGRAISEHLGDALHHFGGVVAHADDDVGSVLA